jgi:Carboxypeptidase regulatory-like domain
MRMKRRKKRTGISLILVLAPLLPLAAAAAKKKPPPQTYAVVSGSVFQENGYALPGANVTLSPEPQPGSSAEKTKKMEAVSSPRGEFAFRVPAGPMHYNVTVEAKGYQSLRKSVSIEGEERVEVTFQLERESK